MKRSKADIMRANGTSSPWRGRKWLINPEGKKGKPDYEDNKGCLIVKGAVRNGHKPSHRCLDLERGRADSTMFMMMREVLHHV